MNPTASAAVPQWGKLTPEPPDLGPPFISLNSNITKTPASQSLPPIAPQTYYQYILLYF